LKDKKKTENGLKTGNYFHKIDILKILFRFGNASSEAERTTIRNQLKMADSNLRRLTLELSKESPVHAHFHQRTPSAPVSMASSDESSQSRGEIQLQKSIEELRETEVDYVNDLWFILGRLAPEIKSQDRDLLFGGLEEIHEFSSGKYLPAFFSLISFES
jgi:hypothetical protein